MVRFQSSHRSETSGTGGPMPLSLRACLLPANSAVLLPSRAHAGHCSCQARCTETLGLQEGLACMAPAVCSASRLPHARSCLDSSQTSCATTAEGMTPREHNLNPYRETLAIILFFKTACSFSKEALLCPLGVSPAVCFLTKKKEKRKVFFHCYHVFNS